MLLSPFIIQRGTLLVAYSIVVLGQRTALTLLYILQSLYQSSSSAILSIAYQ